MRQFLSIVIAFLVALPAGASTPAETAAQQDVSNPPGANRGNRSNPVRGSAAVNRSQGSAGRVPLVQRANDATVASDEGVRRVTSNPNERILHVLNRLTFGPRPGDIEAVRAMGVDAFIEQQLHPASIHEADSVQAVVPSLDALRMDPVGIYNNYGPPAERLNQQKIKQSIIVYDRFNRNHGRISPQQRIFDQITEEKILRCLESTRQLQEVMVEFWFNHFNVYANKGLDHIWLGSYEEQAIRQHAMGKFRDLVEATCHHPAMIFYLDNAQNSANGRKTQRVSRLAD